MSIDVNVQNDLVIVTESSEDITVNVSNAAGPAGQGVPVGGNAGEVLKKQSGTDYDTYWTLDGVGVPYSGATGDVDLGEFELKAGQVEFDQTPTGTAGVGVMRWNDSDGTVDLGLKGGNVTLQVGQEQILRVVNKTGANLLESQYKAVRIRLAAEGGSQGQRLAVVLAQGNNDANSTDTIGIVTENITDNEEGFICTSGIIRGINTTGSLQGETWADGDIIYLSPTIAGAITTVKPTAPNHSVILGYVIYAHNVNGKIFVKCDNGYELGELHDVYVPTPSNNDGIFWNTANSRYQNNTIAGALGFTPISGSGATGQVAYWNGTNSQTGSNNLFWDVTNTRLGIGTNSPSRTLDVRGNARIEAAGNAEFDIIGGGGNILRVATTSTSSFIGSMSAVPLLFFTSANERARFFATGNFNIGGTTDGGQRLQVQGDAFIKGSGATSATTGLQVQNSAGNNMFRIANNGAISLGNSSLRASIFTFTTNQGVIDFSGTNLSFYNSTSNLSATSGAFAFGGDSFFQTTGNQLFFSINMTFVPTSGTATFASLNLSPGINQTGGANGITRGLYVNPTLTAAADWRSIEWSNNSGWGLYGAGTANNYLAGALGIGTTSPANILEIVRNQNASTTLIISNNTNGTLADTRLRFKPNAGSLEMGKYSIAATAYKIFLGSDSFFYNGYNGDISILNDHSTGKIKFAAGASSTAQMTLTAAGRLLLGTTTESTFLLDVNGTARVSGNTTFLGTIAGSNAGRFVIAGGNFAVNITSNNPTNGEGSLITTGAITTTDNQTKNVINVNNAVTSTSASFNTLNGFAFTSTINQTLGIIRGLYINPTLTAATDFRAIEVSAGVSVLAPSTTASATLRIPSGTAPTSPNNGDIWFDGTDLKMRIGGVTKTFTLV